ncbi:MAG: RCC1 domain-containing protein, partial [Oscillospiraceae bacterium]
VTRGENLSGRDTAKANESRYLREILEVKAANDTAANTNTLYLTAEHKLLVAGNLRRTLATERYESASRPTYLRKTITGPSETPAEQVSDVTSFDTSTANVIYKTGRSTDGTSEIWMMGLNNDGQLGRAYTMGQNGDTTDLNSTGAPTQVYAPFGEQPVDGRNLVPLKGIANVALGDQHVAFYAANGNVLDVGSGTSGQLGKSEFLSHNLPVQAGSGDAQGAKGGYVQIQAVADSAVVRTYNSADDTLAPEYITLRLSQKLFLDLTKVQMQFGSGFNLYKNSSLTALPTGAVVTVTSSDTSIATVTVSGNNAYLTPTVVAPATVATKTGTVLLVITVKDAGGKVLAVGNTKVTFTDEKPLTHPMVSAGVTHSAALAEDGSIWIWGSNAYGQLGLPTTVTYKEYPAKLTVMSA